MAEARVEKELESTIPGPASAEALEADSDLDAPPDGGYGWVVVGATFFLNAMTWGQNAVCLI